MSIANSPDCLFRPEDQALRALFPTAEDSSTFDDFFNEGLYDLDADSDCKEPLGNLNDFLGNELDTNECSRLPSLSEPAVQSQSPPQPWRKGLWCLNQRPNANIVVEKTRKPVTDARSSPYFINDENFAVRYPRSPLVSPTVKETKRFATSPNAAPFRYKGSTRLPQSPEATFSPSPMNTSLPIQSKMDQVETWQQDFQNFNLRGPQGRPGQPRRLPSHLQYAQGARHTNAATASQNATIGLAISNYDPLPADMLGSDSSVVIGSNVMDQTNNFGLDMLSSPHYNSSVIQQTSFDQLPITVWTTESLHSASSSHQSYDTLPPSVQSTQSGQSSHEMHKGHMQSWWPAASQTHGQWATNRQTQHMNIAAPMPQRNSARMLVQNFDQAQGGLGIHYPELEHIEQAVFQEPNSFFHNGLPGTADGYSGTSNASHSLNAIPPLPVPPPHSFANPSPFTTPCKTGKSQSRSPPPSVSPMNATARTLRQRSPTRGGYEHTYYRRKSLHKTGPIRDAHEPLPHISVSTSTRSRSRSTSKAPRTPRTPKTPSGGFGTIDFVNFTSKDSLKLLSDVAPSGSSKTRARREAEAREKRKKLSEAALKAVSNAGGDIELLKKAIHAR